MSRPSTVRKPTATELRRVHRWLEKPLLPWQRCRAEVLLLHAADLSAARIAQLLQVHPNTVYADLHDFAAPSVLPGRPACRRGSLTPIPRADRDHLAASGATAHRLGLAVRPLESGQVAGVPHPTTDHQSDQPRAPPPGAEKGGYRLRHVRRKLVCTDPNRPVILYRLRTWWRHRPRRALLAFFDVQPITVKAYGGRRSTRAQRLVLAQNQKTRGRFYLFLLYEVNRGLVHGTFFPGKGAVYVCRFLRRVRRWYPGQSVRIALDRDPGTRSRRRSRSR